MSYSGYGLSSDGVHSAELGAVCRTNQAAINDVNNPAWIFGDMEKWPDIARKQRTYHQQNPF